MTQDHDCTDREDEIFALMMDGDWDEIQAMKDAIGKGKTTPENIEEEDLQFNDDYLNAYNHYQDNHEAPAEERAENVKIKVEEENAAAEAELVSLNEE
jgi:hypothetical protein